MGAERERVNRFGRPEDGLRQAGEWYYWGPYVSERQWGTVREDYSAAVPSSCDCGCGRPARPRPAARPLCDRARRATLSAYHRDHPYEFDVDGYRSVVSYEPAESTTAMFGGNSNWRGPVWLPLNYLIVGSLERYHRFYGDDMTVEYPTGSGKRLTLDLIADDLRDRLISLFTRDAKGRRPCFGGTDRMQTDLAWKDNLIFSEYFHGDNGAAIGAFHQTGWTGLIGDVIMRRRGAVPTTGDVLRDLIGKAQS